MRGGGTAQAVTDEVEALSSTRRCPPHQSPPATASPHRGSLWRFQKSFKRLVDCTDLQLPISIFFCFSKRKRWRVRNDHGGTSRRKRRLLSSVLVSSFPNRELNSRFGGDFDFPSDSLEPTRKTEAVFLDFSRDSLKNQCESVLPNYFFRRTFCRSYSKATAHKSGAPYQAARSKKLVR